MSRRKRKNGQRALTTVWRVLWLLVSLISVLAGLALLIALALHVFGMHAQTWAVLFKALVVAIVILLGVVLRYIVG